MVVGRHSRHEAVRDAAPVRVQLDRGDGEHQEAEADIAEEPLEPLERKHPGDDDDADHAEQDQVAVRQARHELQHDRDAADLRGARQQVHDLGGDEGPESRTEADALTHEVEDRALRDRGDAAAHLGVDDDPDHADHDHPEQLKAERRAGLRVEDEVADVDEAADRRQDAERDLQELLHSCFAIRSRSACTRCCSARSEPLCCSRSRSSRTRTASRASCRPFAEV